MSTAFRVINYCRVQETGKCIRRRPDVNDIIYIIDPRWWNHSSVFLSLSSLWYTYLWITFQRKSSYLVMKKSISNKYFIFEKTNKLIGMFTSWYIAYNQHTHITTYTESHLLTSKSNMSHFQVFRCFFFSSKHTNRMKNTHYHILIILK